MRPPAASNPAIGHVAFHRQPRNLGRLTNLAILIRFGVAA